MDKKFALVVFIDERFAVTVRSFTSLCEWSELHSEYEFGF